MAFNSLSPQSASKTNNSFFSNNINKDNYNQVNTDKKSSNIKALKSSNTNKLTSSQINVDGEDSNSKEEKQIYYGGINLTEYENFDFENDIANDEHKEHIKNFRITKGDIEFKYTLLLKDIDFLHQKISNIQAKHHSDYLSTFNQFMETVKNDIKEKIEKINLVEKEKEKNNNVQLVIADRDMFRQEAIRLNLLCKSLTEQIDLLKRENKFFKSEVDNVIKKWQISEENNRKIIIEMNNCMIMNKELQEKFSNNKFLSSSKQDNLYLTDVKSSEFNLPSIKKKTDNSVDFSTGNKKDEQSIEDFKKVIFYFRNV